MSEYTSRNLCDSCDKQVEVCGETSVKLGEDGNVYDCDLYTKENFTEFKSVCKEVIEHSKADNYGDSSMEIREILFSGFCPRDDGSATIVLGEERVTGEWVEGYYSPLVVPMIGELGHYINVGGYKAVEVIRETVSQYAGFEDKNGDKVFEHYLVYRSDNRKTYIVECKKGCFRFKGDTEIVRADEVEFAFEVIGNIFEEEEN